MQQGRVRRLLMPLLLTWVLCLWSPWRCLVGQDAMAGHMQGGTYTVEVWHCPLVALPAGSRVLAGWLY